MIDVVDYDEVVDRLKEANVAFVFAGSDEGIWYITRPELIALEEVPVLLRNIIELVNRQLAKTH